MSFDLSRVRFNARNDFFGVVMQQGRVQLDSDWNEWVAQLVRRIQAGTLDTVGKAVVPRETPDGFLIQALGGRLTIGPGRIYVDGLLAENHGAQPDSWERRLAEEVGTAAVDYDRQPYCPWLNGQEPPDLPPGGPHLVYLDVWRRDVTHLQKPDLVEPAVGVDTAGRQQTVWQVKLLTGVGDITCDTDEKDIPGWIEATRPSEGRLSTATGDAPGEVGPCPVPPKTGYLGLENQLYRVEIHKGGPRGTATFKWSRDNATVATAVTHINPSRDQLTVESVGRDDVLRFHNGDWVEITDDWCELRGLPGDLRRIRAPKGVDPDARTITLDTALPADRFPVDGKNATARARHTRIRRWDQSGQVHEENGDSYPKFKDGEITVPDDGTRLFLENGILVGFDVVPGPGGRPGEFRSGDYWVFAARTTEPTLEILDKAPPLGIHHHYARLAVVTFPDAEADCRTLWPPKLDSECCDCTICVKAEAHNEGTATLQQAIDKVKESGGTVCLEAGTFRIREPLRIAGANSIRVRGQGWKTVLLGRAPGAIVEISDGTGVVLENLTVIGSSAGDKVTSAVSVANVVDLRLSHVNVVQFATGEATGVALEMSGYLVGCEVADCVLAAERGITASGGKRDYLLTAELRVRGNLFYCKHRGVSFDGISFHAGNSALTDNLILGCTDASVTATGGVLAGSTFTVSDNVIFTGGTGVRAGVDGLRIDRNEITGVGDKSGDGISIERGLDPVGIDRAQIIGNRITRMAGHGVAIRHRAEDSMIKQNMIGDVGLGGLVVERGGSAHTMVIENNRFSGLGRSLKDSKVGFAGVQLLALDRADVLNNLVEGVAGAAVRSPETAAVVCLGSGDVRIGGNRIHGVGPQEMTPSSFAAALWIPALHGHLAVDDNTVGREGSDVDRNGMARWYALLVGRGGEEGETGTAILGGGYAYIDLKKRVFLLTAARVRAFNPFVPRISARGNRFSSRFTTDSLVRIEGAEFCLFAENQCEVSGKSGAGAGAGQLATIRSSVVNASNNRLSGVGGPEALSLQITTDDPKDPGKVVVVGNLSTGMIRVGVNYLAEPWKPLNVRFA